MADVVAARCVAAHVTDEAHQRVCSRAVINGCISIPCSNMQTNLSRCIYANLMLLICGQFPPSRK